MVIESRLHLLTDVCSYSMVDSMLPSELVPPNTYMLSADKPHRLAFFLSVFKSAITIHSFLSMKYFSQLSIAVFS